MVNACFWKNKRILITGHTGFKGSWLTLLLNELGAKLFGLSLRQNEKSNLFYKTKINKLITNYYGNITNEKLLKEIISHTKPEIIFHLAAQSLVLKSYEKPIETIKSNILGSAIVINSFINSKNPKVLINVTSDKVYKNNNLSNSFVETDELGGEDPYSASKACVEIISNSMAKSFSCNKSICNVRAGNVIGGGDWSDNRLIPDIIKSVKNNRELQIRYPNSTRPWQFVLDPLIGYLQLAEKAYNDPINYNGSWNFGPHDKKQYSVNDILEFCKNNFFKHLQYNNLTKANKSEAKYLNVNSNKAKKTIGWLNKTSTEDALNMTFEWYLNYLENNNIEKLCKSQVKDFLNKYEY